VAAGEWRGARRRSARRRVTHRTHRTAVNNRTPDFIFPCGADGSESRWGAVNFIWGHRSTRHEEPEHAPPRADAWPPWRRLVGPIRIHKEDVDPVRILQREDPLAAGRTGRRRKLPSKLGRLSWCWVVGGVVPVAALIFPWIIMLLTLYGTNETRCACAFRTYRIVAALSVDRLWQTGRPVNFGSIQAAARMGS
jgi:hypothetical protein